MTQAACWRQAADLARHRAIAAALPRPGERVAVTGCGSSLFMATAYASLRERAGHGVTDAFPASERPARSGYDRLVALTRSGTTTEVIDVLRAAADVPTTVLTADADTPVAAVADAVIAMPFADERSVVATRSSTSALALLRTSLGGDDARAVERAIADVPRMLAADVGAWLDTPQVTFLGRGWTIGLAHEAALKLREAAAAWTESYPAMEYRHGPISVAEPGRLVWLLGDPPAGLADDVARTGAMFVTSGDVEPMAHLVLAQRLATDVAVARGLDPDRPRHLTRSVVLAAAGRPDCPT